VLIPVQHSTEKLINIFTCCDGYLLVNRNTSGILRRLTDNKEGCDVLVRRREGEIKRGVAFYFHA